MRRNNRQEQAIQTNQVGVIYVTRFIEQKEIGVAQEHQRRAEAIQKSERHEQREDAKHGPVKVEPVPRPGMHPGEPVVFEEKLRLEPKVINRLVAEITADLPDHQQSARDPTENQRCDIDRPEAATWQSGNTRL